MRARRFVVTSGIAAVMLAGGVMLAPRRAGAAATIVVNTTADEDVDNADCSICEAIIAANTNASYKGCAAAGAGVNDMIVFDLGRCNRRINIGTTPLPAITEWVTIDGGARRARRAARTRRPTVSGRHGLTVNADRLRHDHPQPRHQQLRRRRHLHQRRRSVGPRLLHRDRRHRHDGHAQSGLRRAGLRRQRRPHRRRNLRRPLHRRLQRHLRRDQLQGQRAAGPQRLNALVRGNFIGTDVTGTAGITPQDVQGIVDKGSGNRIGGTGGTTPGGACTGDCNLISGNNIDGGIVIDQAATGSVIQGNFIGTDVTGNGAISNGISARLLGGHPELRHARRSAAPRRRRATSSPATSAPASRCAASRTRGAGNYVGTNSAGTAAVPNSGPGVTLSPGRRRRSSAGPSPAPAI